MGVPCGQHDIAGGFGHDIRCAGIDLSLTGSQEDAEVTLKRTAAAERSVIEIRWTDITGKRDTFVFDNHQISPSFSTAHTFSS